MNKVSKVYLETNEDILYALDKIQSSAGEKVAVMLPVGAQIGASQVSLKLLNRMILKTSKVVVLVTEEPLVHNFAKAAKLLAVQKVSEITGDIWEHAFSLKQKLSIAQDKKKMQLLENRSGKDFQIREASTQEQTEKITLDNQGKQVEQQKQAVPATPKSEAMQNQPQAEPSKSQEVDSLFKKFEPKIIETGDYALLSGGDITQTILGKTLQNKLKNMAKLEELESGKKKDSVASEPPNDSEDYLEPEKYQEEELERRIDDAEEPYDSGREVEEKGEERELVKKELAPVPPKAAVATNTSDNFVGRDLTNFSGRRSARVNTRRQRARRQAGLLGNIKTQFSSISLPAISFSGINAGGQRLKLGLLGFFVVILILLLLGYTNRTATVSVVLASNTAQLNEQVSAQADANAVEVESKVLPLGVLTKSGERSSSGDATGTAIEGEKASTTINIFNENNEPATLDTGAELTLEGSDNLRFLLVNEVTVPAEGTASSIKIVAEEIGEQYNRSGNQTKRFTANFDGASGLTFFTSAEITGGNEEEVPAVTEQDIKELREELVGALRASLQLELQELVADTERVLQADPVFSEPDVTVSAKAGDKVNSFDLEVQMEGRLYVVSESDLESLAEELIRQQSEFGPDVEVSGLEGLEIGDIKLQGDQANFNLSLSGDFSAIVDEDQLKSELVGLDIAAAEEQLAANQSISSASVQIHAGPLPTFLLTMPAGDRITIE